MERKFNCGVMADGFLLQIATSNAQSPVVHNRLAQSYTTSTLSGVSE